jgi:hypothetical protein
MELHRLERGYKLAITLFLINILLGLIYAHVQVRYAVEAKDGEPGISLTDLRLFFQGDPTSNRLQTQINGSMHGKFASPEEKIELDDWIAAGAPRDVYDSTIAPILEARCISCHGPGGAKSQSPLTNYDEVGRYTQFSDTGVSYEYLAQISYLHLAVLACFTALVAALCYMTRYRGTWKQVIVVLPFIAAACNVLSWWSAKQSIFFIHLIVASGIAFAGLILLMVALILFDLWILPPED